MKIDQWIMSKLFTAVLILIFSLSVKAQQGWYWVNPLPQGNHLNKVVTISPTQAIAVGRGGAILLTTDQGATWELENSGTIEDLYGVTFSDSLNGIAVGDKSTVIKTTDGGHSWRRLFDGGTLLLRDVFFNYEGLVVVVGRTNDSKGLILRSTNGGGTWSTQIFNNSRLFYTVHFKDGNNGFALSVDGFYSTSDGGITWSTQPGFGGIAASIPEFNTIFILQQIGFTSTYQIYKTTDYGNSWNIISLHNNFYNFSFIDRNNGFVNGFRGEMYRTTDGGVTFIQQNTNQTQPLNSIALFDSITCIVVGGIGTIVRTTNAGNNWLIVSHNFATNTLDNDLVDIDFINDNEGFILDYRGILYCTTNAGISWLPKVLPGSSHHCVSALDRNHYAVGGFDLISITTNGGLTWNSPNVANGHNIYSISYADSNNILAVGDRIIFRSTDGGITWSNQSSSCDEGLITHRDRNNVFVAGSISNNLFGNLLRSTNGGVTWNTVSSGTTSFQPLKNITFFDSLNGTMLGCFGTVYRTSDGGNTWPIYSNTGLYFLYSASFTDKENCTVICNANNRSIIVRTTNGGISWFQQKKITSEIMQKVFFINQNCGYISGENGIILKTTDGGGSPFITPVELVSFTGKQYEKGIKLEWETATELNNLSFIIQRSNDGTSFYNIGNVKGNGTSTIRHQYQFNDELLTMGTYYYRLRQTDFDGSANTSDIIKISFYPNKNDLIQNYPNPFYCMH